jgi:hypothetical protein
VLGERILGILEDCWQRRDADGVIAQPDEETGFSMDTVYKTTAGVRYVKDLAMRDRQEGAVVLTIQEYEGGAVCSSSDGMHISLRLVDQEGDEDEWVSAEEIVSRFELLRDCWVQLTDGLEVEELGEKAQENGEEL